MDERRFEELKGKIGYSFKDKDLLRKALTHKSFSFEKDKKENYEVLEFLGDAVIGLIVSEELIKQFPTKSEGELSQIRAYLVSEPSLSELAKTVDLGSYIYLGKGEYLSGGRKKSSILCDVFESLFGAIYLDSNFETAGEVFKKNFLSKMWKILERAITYKDFKSLLQEVTQKEFKVVPIYTVIKSEGPEHEKVFTVECRVKDLKTISKGRSKKSAEQQAAKEMLKVFGVINENK